MSGTKKRSKINDISLNPDPMTGKFIIQPLPPNFFQFNGASTKSSAQKTSSAKKTFAKNPMFEKDPKTGRLTLLPLNLQSLEFDHGPKSNSGKNQGKKWSDKKRQSVDTDKEGFVRPNKIRKLDFGLNKKSSQNSARSSQVMNSRRTSLKGINRKILNPKRSTIPLKKQNIKDTSGLLDLEEVEDILINKKSSLRGYPFKSPKLVRSNLNFCAASKSAKKMSTPVRMSRISEEQSNMTTDENYFKMSQITFNKVTKILQSDGSARKVYQKAHQRYVEEMNKYLEAQKIYEQQHEKNMSVLADLLLASQEGNKENINPQVGIPLQETSTPLKPQNYNLRISTLKKNFSETTISNLQTPKTENALKLYNSLRLGCTILETPRLEEKTNKKYTKSAAKELSQTILNQCLLLQGTPKKD